MANLNLGTNKKAVSFGKPIPVTWDSFRRGLNLLLQDVELNKEEVRKIDNMILKGAGILTQRPGFLNYYLGGSGRVRLTKPYYAKSGTVEHLSLTDLGYLVKKSSASYAIIPGASFASGSKATAAQIYNNVYIASISYPLRKYDGTTLFTYAGISMPSIISATKSSGTSGVFTWSWRVSAESDLGETLAAAAITLANLPENLTTANYVTISWTSIANARGYVIYGRDSGNETFLSRVPPSSLSFIDDGSNVPSFIIFPPEADFTAGPQGKYVIAFREKLVLANLLNNPSRLVFSGGGPNVDKFHWSKGGGYVDISKDDGEVITGLTEGDQGRIIVFKERSIYSLTLTYNSTLGIVEPSVQKITGAIGCLSHQTIQIVENDIFYVGRRAGGGVSLNSLGYEANFTNILRTSEISNRVQPEMESINLARIDEMHTRYFNSILWFFYPVGGTSIRAIGYDRQRLAWVGPHDFANNFTTSDIFYDSSGVEHLLAGADNGYILEISKSYKNDNGTNFTWTYESKKEEVGDPLTLKNLISFFLQLRNVVGTVNVEIVIESKSGTTTTTKSFQISSPNAQAGWGSFRFGLKAFGGRAQKSSGTTNSGEIIRYITLNKSGIRSYKIKISGTGSQADIVAMKSILTPSSQIPSNWRVS